MRKERERETAHTLAAEAQLDLGVRAAHEVDGRGRAGLVHRDGGRAVARDPGALAERLRHRVTERREDVLDEMVVVDVEVAAGDELEVEAGVERGQSEQVIEEADARPNAHAPARRGRARAAARSRS